MDRIKELENRYKASDQHILATHNTEQCISILRQHNLMRSKSEVFCDNDNCSFVGSPVVEIADKSRIDGAFFRCPHCKQKKCLRTNSIFQGTKMPLISIYKFMFVYFVENESIVSASSQTLLSECSTKMIYRFCKKQISKVEDDLIVNTPLCQIDNYNRLAIPTVEVDESLFTHLRGDYDSRTQSQCWIFGAVERLNGDFRCIAIGPTRSQEILSPIIRVLIASQPERKTHIYTDGGTFYNFLNNNNSPYQRTVVIHDHGFGRGTETTNRIEGLWGELKRLGKFSQGLNFTTVQQVQDALNELCWRVRHKNSDKYAIFTELLSRNYQMDNSETILQYQ